MKRQNNYRGILLKGMLLGFAFTMLIYATVTANPYLVLTGSSLSTSSAIDTLDPASYNSYVTVESTHGTETKLDLDAASNKGQLLVIRIKGGSSPIRLETSTDVRLSGGKDALLDEYDTITLLATNNSGGWVELSRTDI